MRNQITKSQLQSLPTLAAAAAETNFPFWLGIENMPVSLYEKENQEKVPEPAENRWHWCDCHSRCCCCLSDKDSQKSESKIAKCSTLERERRR